MEIVPTVNPKLSDAAASDKSLTFQPEVSQRASRRAGTANTSVHERLYADAVHDQEVKHNTIAELIKTKLNVSLAPWEEERDHLNKSASWTAAKSHVQKSTFGPIFDQLIIPFGENPTVALVEHDDSVKQIWKSLRAAADPDERIPVHM